MPFEVPEGWVWTTVSDISKSILYGVSESAKPAGKYKLLRITDIQNNQVDWETVPFTDFDDNKVSSYILCNGDILFARTGATVGKSYLIKNLTQKAIYASYLIRVQTFNLIIPEYVKLFFESEYYWAQIELNSVGIGQPNVNGTILGSLNIPLPPLSEQKRIVIEIERWLSLINAIENNKVDLQTAIKQTKSKILDLAIHGKLVPQDPNDEPASELLKRINLKAKITCDNGHYPQLPAGWAICRLEDIVKYKQPQAYIVSSTNYDDSYTTPVLTAGKSFIIGYTDDMDGIYTKLPCIIFDDFTTDSRLVDFPFKVKSSAMKILQVVKGIEIEYVAMFMSITRLISDTHKRYWISEYSKLYIAIPPIEEQRRIINTTKSMFEKLDAIMENL
ncbi:MAG: restriction endonuclease subunit S [Alistipes sp.]|nr:restriction endonuclease subunit S [Alistipes sp.]